MPDYGDTASYEYEFWTEQKESVLKGYIAGDNHYLNPYTYFWCNGPKMGTLKPETEEADWSHPYFLKKQEELFDLLYYNRFIPKGVSGKAHSKPAQDVVASKGRRKGWSQMMIKGHCMYYATVLCKNIAICADSESTRDEMKDEFMSAYESLPAFYKGYDIVVNTKDRLIFGEWLESVDGKRRYKKSHTIYFYPMDKSPGKLRGLKLWLIFLDEVGKYTNLKEVIAVSKECLMEGTLKFGQMVVGGTSDAISNKSPDYKELFFDAKNGRIDGWHPYFIAADEISLPDIDYTTGESLRHLSKPKYLAERDKKRKLGNMRDYWRYVAENPLDDTEGFLAGGGDTYDQDEINDQHTWIIENFKEEDLFRGKLSEAYTPDGKPSGRVRVVEDAEGPWEFYRPAFPGGTLLPQLADDYLITTDDFYLDEAKYSKSKGAILLYLAPTTLSMESDLPIALYHDRPSKTGFAYEVYKVMKMSGGKALIENNDGTLEKDLKKRGLGNRLALINNKVGIRHSDNWRNREEMLGQNFIADKRHRRIYFPRILDALKAPSEINNDPRSTMEHMFLYLDREGKEAVVKTEVEQRQEASELMLMVGPGQAQSVLGNSNEYNISLPWMK